MAQRLKTGFRNGFYAVCVVSLCGLVKLFFRLRVTGRENIAPGESYIVVARHRSYWDIPIVAVAIGARNPLHFIARKGLLKGVFIVQPLIHVYSTLIDRESFGIADFRRMHEAIRKHRLVFIFPEGTTRRRVDAKGGAVYFASAAGKRILPINIQADGPYPPKHLFGFPRVTVSIGAPIELSDLEGPDSASRSEKLRAMSERLMDRVDRT